MDASYDTTAEFHEIHMQPAWDRLHDVMRDTFGDIGPDAVIVDIGAGSGMGSAVLADITNAEIIALEPNITMRSMLMARLDQAGVLERVTVIPAAVPEGLQELPDRVDGVIATHMLGHLTSAERTTLLDWIATSLAPGRTALLTVTPEAMQEVPAEGTEPVVTERNVGRFVYRMTYHMPRPGRYEGLWEVIDRQGRVVRSVPDATSWDPVTVDDIRTAADIRAALAGSPVEVSAPLDGVALISKLST